MDVMAVLTIEQNELRAAAVGLRELAASATPPDRAVLTEARWRVARSLLRHLPHKDRMVYARLKLHHDPAVVATAKRFSDEAAALYAKFEQHAERWTPEAVEAEWPLYRAGVQRLTHMLEDRIASEERELLPHLAGVPTVPPSRSDGDRNWAGDGWKMRARLGIG